MRLIVMIIRRASFVLITWCKPIEVLSFLRSNENICCVYTWDEVSIAYCTSKNNVRSAHNGWQAILTCSCNKNWRHYPIGFVFVSPRSYQRFAEMRSWLQWRNMAFCTACWDCWKWRHHSIFRSRFRIKVVVSNFITHKLFKPFDVPRYSAFSDSGAKNWGVGILRPPKNN